LAVAGENVSVQRTNLLAAQSGNSNSLRRNYVSAIVSCMAGSKWKLPRSTLLTSGARTRRRKCCFASNALIEKREQLWLCSNADEEHQLPQFFPPRSRPFPRFQANGLKTIGASQRQPFPDTLPEMATRCEY